ncbi:glycosyltransferase family 2 protein [Tateyamaria sp. SN6-1]|uniref:glycosyltransferase family 2 protein n=1 Tax=Tateyamaria sp. SN6-1 TaxID=3092148 RepID=UPI0039F54E90
MIRAFNRPVSGSWSVTATVAEPPELLCAFAAHYLDLGAEEVHLFLDNPDQPGVDMLEAMDGVRVTLCTPRHWQKLNRGRPDRHIMRQLKNANAAYAQCRSEWFLFCDADEFVVSKPPIQDLLAALPATVVHTRVPVVERVFRSETAPAHLFDGVFRTQLRGQAEVLEDVYGDMANLTTRGLTGHVVGKSFVRAGRKDQRIRIHFPVPFDPSEEARQRDAGTLKPGPDFEGAWLVHFDGMTPLHWLLKLMRKSTGRMQFKKRTPARSRQLNAIYDALGDGAALARFEQLISLDPAQRARLDAAGGILDIALDPRLAVERHLGQRLPFDAASFDAGLRTQHAALIAEHGLLLGSPDP